MDENKVLKDSLMKINDQLRNDKIEELGKSLLVSKDIIDKGFQLDNSPSDYEIIVKGERVNIVKKDSLYYLQRADNPNLDLYHPSEDYKIQYDLWVQSNSD